MHRLSEFAINFQGGCYSGDCSPRGDHLGVNRVRGGYCQTRGVPSTGDGESLAAVPALFVFATAGKSSDVASFPLPPLVTAVLRHSSSKFTTLSETLPVVYV